MEEDRLDYCGSEWREWQAVVNTVMDIWGLQMLENCYLDEES